ncbi:MAG: hypothetical protein SGJ19_10480 [Planctomycetia bacterium]|nr:hypothetical protein [Planctomycetia bacterium]
MLRRAWCLLVAGMFVGLIASRASALTEVIDVTPEWLSAQPEGGKEFTIEAVELETGLIEFTITRRVLEDRYRVGRLDVRMEGELAAECLLKPDEKPRLIKYRLKLSKKAVAESEFEFSEHGLVRSGGEEIGLPGGIVYRFKLADFYRPPGE